MEWWHVFSYFLVISEVAKLLYFCSSFDFSFYGKLLSVISCMYHLNNKIIHMIQIFEDYRVVDRIIEFYRPVQIYNVCYRAD